MRLRLGPAPSQPRARAARAGATLALRGASWLRPRSARASGRGARGGRDVSRTKKAARMGQAARGRRSVDAARSGSGTPGRCSAAPPAAPKTQNNRRPQTDH